jgi:CspA family cold shock protein
VISEQFDAQFDEQVEQNASEQESIQQNPPASPEHRPDRHADRHDQVLYCERCGISFLWPKEEQSEALARSAEPAPPRHCPGCRRLLPTDGRERGLVKWYNHSKRYGFVVRQQQADLFVHGSDLVDSARLQPGDLVEFSVGSGERGPAAKEVQVLALSVAQGA